MKTVGRRIVIEPVLEMPSALLTVPVRTTRWRKENKLSICGKVVAVGRDAGVEVGTYVYHSDSCGEFIDNDRYRVIHEDDVMFMSDELMPAQWIGAEENYDA